MIAKSECAHTLLKPFDIVLIILELLPVRADPYRWLEHEHCCDWFSLVEYCYW